MLNHQPSNNVPEMLNLNTPEEMYDYCIKNKLGMGVTKGWSIKHFKLLLDNVKPDEAIYCVFIGLHNYKNGKHDGNYAYAFTDRRIIMAQHKLLGANVQSINIENLNDITLAKNGFMGIGIGTVCFDTFKETFSVGVNVTFADTVYLRTHEVWDMVRARQITQATVQQVINPIEQIKEYKDLLDLGIITQSEFDAKKRELLGF